jgi:hypothetical protein
MTDANSTRLLRLGKQIADLEHARRSLPMGFTWTGDCQIAALRVEKQRVENLVVVPDRSGGGGSGSESAEEPESAAAETAASTEAEGPHSSGTEATRDRLPEPEAATDVPVQAATPRDGQREEDSAEPQHSSAPPAVPAEPVSDPSPPDSGASDSPASDSPASDSPASDNDPPNAGDVSDAALIVFIRDKCCGRVKARDLQRRNGKRWPDAPSARAKLSELVRAGLLEWIDGEEGETARPKNAPEAP